MRGQAHLQFSVLAWIPSEAHLEPRILVQVIEEGLPELEARDRERKRGKGMKPSKGLISSEAPGSA